jgi:pimeloyl-ACP methyl ester carboxylesterase
MTRVSDRPAFAESVAREGALPFLALALMIGHSYGGLVALHYAARHPDQVAGLTVADSRLGAFQSNLQLVEWLGAGADRQRVERVAAAVAGDVGRNERRRGPVGAVGPTAAGPAARARRVSMSSRTADRWLTLLGTTTASLELLEAAGPSRAELAEIRTPVLAVYGEFSDFLPSCWGLMRTLPDCRVVVVPGAGHFHPRARPDVFVREVRRFLREVSGSEGGRP